MDKQRTFLLLNRLLANYFVMFVKCKRYTWYAKGAHVIQMKNFYNDLAFRLLDDIEDISEHILIIGGKPFATMIKYLKEATIEEATADDEEEEMTEKLTSDFTTLIKTIKEEIYVHAKKIEDEVTVQLLTTLEKNLLMYRHTVLSMST